MFLQGFIFVKQNKVNNKFSYNLMSKLARSTLTSSGTISIKLTNTFASEFQHLVVIFLGRRGVRRLKSLLPET
jgi:hypothetical protein